MTNLLALCKRPDGAVSIKRVQISQPVQATIGGLFQQQAAEFLEGVENEIPFGGDYKPDADELLYLDAPDENTLMQQALADPMALETTQAGRFANEHIRGLFVSIGTGDAARILIQAFNAQQLLGRSRIALIFDDDVFRYVTEPSFTLDNKLVAVAENGRLKFKSFHFLKRIFVLEDVYRVATDQQIDAFCGHASLHVADLAALKASADQIVRRLIHAVQAANVLDHTPVADIQTKAAALGMALALDAGRIVMPTDRQELKVLLRFLDDSIYEGPLSSRRLMANSKRAL